MASDAPSDGAGESNCTGPRSRADDGFAELQTWILSLPWVVGAHGEADAPHHIVIDCPPLNFRRVWAIVVSDADRGHADLYVVATADFLRVVCGMAWFTGIVQLEGGISLCRVDLGLSSEDVEMLLLATYGMMFPAYRVVGEAPP